MISSSSDSGTVASPPVISAYLSSGAWIDHAVQPDVPYENWLYYLELKNRLLEGHFA